MVNVEALKHQDGGLSCVYVWAVECEVSVFANEVPCNESGSLPKCVLAR